MVKPGEIIEMPIQFKGGIRNVRMLVVSKEEYNNRLGMALVVPLVHKEPAHALEVPCNGMVILSDQVRSIDLNIRSYSGAGTASRETLEDVRRILRRIID